MIEDDTSESEPKRSPSKTTIFLFTILSFVFGMIIGALVIFLLSENGESSDLH